MDNRIERQGGCNRNVGTGNLQLQFMDKVGKGRIAEETLTGIDGVLEAADLAVYISLHGVDVFLEMADHLFVDLLIEHADNLSLDVLFNELALVERQFNLCFCHILHIAGWVDDQYLLTFFVGNPLIVYLMVVTEEDDIEAGHLTGYSCRCILFVTVGNDATVLA